LLIVGLSLLIVSCERPVNPSYVETVKWSGVLTSLDKTGDYTYRAVVDNKTIIYSVPMLKYRHADVIVYGEKYEYVEIYDSWGFETYRYVLRKVKDKF
jgi:hypothetical protein